MFINLSSDNIYILTGETRIDLSRGQLERNISQIIIDVYNEHKPKNIYILNGPGSFTNLRLGCLAINLLIYMLQQSGQDLPNIYMTDKISLYKSFNLPILIYIGQKNNYRFLNKDEIQKVSLDDVDSKNIYLDDLSDSINLGLSKLRFKFTENAIRLDFDDKYIDDIDYSSNIIGLFELLPSGHVTPNYMIEPNIS